MNRGRKYLDGRLLIVLVEASPGAQISAGKVEDFPLPVWAKRHKVVGQSRRKALANVQDERAVQQLPQEWGEAFTRLGVRSVAIYR